MKKIRSFILSFMVLAISVTAFAAIGPVNFQGRLLDENGIPLTNNDVDFTIRLYDAVTGGTLLFEEEHFGEEVDDGVYSFLLGNGSLVSGTWDISLWNGGGSVYLEIQVGAETLSPRQLMAAAPISFQAANTEMLDNKPADDYAEDSEVDALLSEVCASNKGVWLSQYSKCAGGSVDLNSLDLSGLTISGVEFDGADLRYTNNDNTDYSNSMFFDVEFTGGPGISFNNTDFTNAEWKDLDAKWLFLNSIVYDDFYAHELLGCPDSLPDDWQCVEDGNFPGEGLYVLIGPSARLVDEKGRNGQQWNSGHSFVDALFDSANMTNNNFDGTNLSGADFYNSTLVKATFTNTNLSAAYFDSADLTNATIVGATMDGSTDFTSTSLNGLSATAITGCPVYLPANWVCLDDGGTNVLIGPYAWLGRNGSVAGHTWASGCKDFSLLEMSNANFSNSDFTAATICGGQTFESIRMIGTSMYYIKFDDVVVSNGFDIRMKDCQARWGSFRNINLSGATIENCFLRDVDFSGADLSNLNNDGNNNFINANFTNATLLNTALTDGQVTGATWSNTICPDGTNSNDNGDTCIGHLTPG